MALLTATVPTVIGTLAAPAAMSTADTINGNYAPNGALKVINGSASSVNFNLVDPGATAAGNAGTQAVTAIAAGASKWFALSSAYVDPDDNLIHTVLSLATTITYELIP